MDVKKKIFKSNLFSKSYNLKKLLAEKYNNEQNKIKVINVIGTNGKGSVSNYLQKQLMNSFTKVGLLTSPAFLKHNERIKINNDFISDRNLKKLWKVVQAEAKAYQLTFFEIWVLMAIRYFIMEKVEVAVIEAGIGGELDATNVFANQWGVLLTSVSLDHTEILGPTVEEITLSKIKIWRGECPVYISNSCQKYLPTIQEVIPSDKIIVATKYEYAINYFQGFNVGLVIAFLKNNNLPINYDLFKTPPLLGRFTILSKSPYFIIDGAHNIEGIEACIQAFEELEHLDKENTVVLYAASKKKDFHGTLAILKEHFGSKLYITNFKNPLAWEIDDVVFNNKVKKWQQFLKQNKNKNILVCGSLYFIPLVYKFYLERM
ncbi:bifunctional folylpolyglutamate synthase/dihydrofolate synthase [Spiroplasma chrysopicola]|uniref:Folylpolyglutamate synthase n=1 Tax=Spiroplasma chrysopicola DF-1 TaxID=1276227 RepID=R4UA28_9MOLU|nr:cyanophycin synthetase [Spiroplasma chrysopicola]AGM24724.1 folylpolyglutamate synthase [Spiroplasma chrysopicola DF-1]